MFSKKVFTTNHYLIKTEGLCVHMSLGLWLLEAGKQGHSSEVTPGRWVGR